MLAVSLIQAGPDTDLSWILYVLLGVLLFVVIIGALTSWGSNRPALFSEREPRKTNKKTIKDSSKKNLKH